MTVYVIQDQKTVDNRSGELRPKFDFTPAKEFGELEFLLWPSASPFSLDGPISALHEKLRNYRDGDYLLLVGNPVLLGLAVAVAADYNMGNVNLLQWSGARRTYLPVHVKNLYRDIAVPADDCVAEDGKA
jgi:hypothetical protein